MLKKKKIINDFERSSLTYFNEISANNLTSVFKTSGGSNLLRNSVGYAGTDFWLTSGTITTNQNDDMSLSGSEFILTNNASLQFTRSLL